MIKGSLHSHLISLVLTSNHYFLLYLVIYLVICDIE